MTFDGIITLERKFRDSMVTTIVVNKQKPLPGDGEYQVLVQGMMRKLVISGGVVQLYLLVTDEIEFGSQIQITIL